MSNFICPECKSNTYKSHIYVSTYPDLNDPWSNVLQQYECANCNNYIPAHLAERWKDISFEKAMEEWINIYKKS